MGVKTKTIDLSKPKGHPLRATVTLETPAEEQTRLDVTAVDQAVSGKDRESLKADIKKAASQKILDIFPEWKQRNVTAHAVVIERAERKGEPLSAADLAAIPVYEALWADVVTIRSNSDEAEADIDAMPSIEKAKTVKLWGPGESKPYSVPAPLVVDAGPYQSPTLSEGNPTPTATMNATVTGGTAPLSYLWELDSGPGKVTFDDNTIEAPVATFDTIGDYYLKLTVTDEDQSVSDTVHIKVQAAV